MSGAQAQPAMSQHGQRELRKSLEARDVCLGCLGEFWPELAHLWPELAHLCHGPRFGEPEKFGALIHPPMPTVSPSAIASAAAMQ